MNRAVMCHVVAGYPDPKTCLQLMRGMHDSGVAAIEVQIPFSDPIADGEIIMQANDVALSGGMTTAGSFALIRKARQAGVDADLYVMSYMQKVLHFGLPEFCEQAASCGVKGLIIPDLPYDTEEFTSLHKHAAGQNLTLVPVVSPGMSPIRLEALLAFDPPVIYVTSQRGITGNEYGGGQQLQQLVTTIKERSKATIMIGFGISTSEDVQQAFTVGDVAVVGSAVIQKLRDQGPDAALNLVRALSNGGAAT
jgi:tryptophan synthase alpha chain